MYSAPTSRNNRCKESGSGFTPWVPSRVRYCASLSKCCDLIHGNRNYNVDLASPWQDENKGIAAFAPASSSANPVDIVSGFTGCIILHNPVNLGKVKSPCCNICTKLKLHDTMQITYSSNTRKTLTKVSPIYRASLCKISCKLLGELSVEHFRASDTYYSSLCWRCCSSYC